MQTWLVQFKWIPGKGQQQHQPKQGVVISAPKAVYQQQPDRPQPSIEQLLSAPAPTAPPPRVSKPVVLQTSHTNTREAKRASKSARNVLSAVLGSTPTSPEKLKKLKSQLAEPKQARRIVHELKVLDETKVRTPHSASAHEICAKGVCLTHADGEVGGKSTASNSGADPAAAFPIINLMSSIPSAGSMLGTMVQQAGVYDALASVSGEMIGHALSEVRPPRDRMSVFVCAYTISQLPEVILSHNLADYWGFEICLPPPSLVYLSKAHSLSGTFFTFLQAVVMGGGAPELGPFIR